jgi:hypothetical protein
MFIGPTEESPTQLLLGTDTHVTFLIAAYVRLAARDYVAEILSPLVHAICEDKSSMEVSLSRSFI